MRTDISHIWQLRAESSGRFHIRRVNPDDLSQSGEITPSMTEDEVRAAYRAQFPRLQDSEIERRIDDARTLFERIQRMRPGGRIGDRV